MPKFHGSKTISHGLAVIFFLCQSALAAESVRDIQADKLGYLRDHFSTRKAEQGVIQEITKSDTGAVNFQKLIFTVTPVVTMVQSTGAPGEYKSTWTYIPAGGPFVGLLDEETSNGFATAQTYNLLYRGLISISNQSVPLGSPNAAPIREMKKLTSFSALTVAKAGEGELDYQYEYAPSRQIWNFKQTYLHCVYGVVYPASNINAKLMGDAQDLECEMRNDNNVAGGRLTYALLTSYGIAITKKLAVSNRSTVFNIEDAKVE
jgi:hypothetical protein